MAWRMMELDWGLGISGGLGLRSRMTMAGAVLQRFSFFFRIGGRESGCSVVEEASVISVSRASASGSGDSCKETTSL